VNEGFTPWIENGENSYDKGGRRLTVRWCEIRVEKVNRKTMAESVGVVCC